MSFEKILNKFADITVKDSEANIFINNILSSKCADGSRIEPIIKIRNVSNLDSVKGWQKVTSLFVTAAGTISRTFFMCLNALWIKIRNIKGIKTVIDKIAKILSKAPFISSIKNKQKEIWNKYVGFGGLYVRVGDIINTAILGIAIAIVGRAIYTKYRKKEVKESIDIYKETKIGDLIKEDLNAWFMLSEDQHDVRNPRRPKQRKEEKEPSFLDQIGRFLKQFLSQILRIVKELFAKIIAILIVASILLLIGMLLKIIVCKLSEESPIRRTINYLVNIVLSQFKAQRMDICEGLPDTKK